MELRIREFQKKDMDAVYFLDQGCYPVEQRSSFNVLLETLLDRDCAALVAEEIGEGYARIIAALIVQGDPWHAKLYIVSLMVDEEFRKLGIARRLLGWAERLASSFKCDTLLVRLPEDYAPGEAFLSANGFTVSGEEGTEKSVEKGGGRPGVLWMREVSEVSEVSEEDAP